MTVTKSKGVTRKLGPISLGRKTISFKTRNLKRQFTVHEDLVCATSKFFTRKLQKKRKRIEGECAICHENLDPVTSDITFCRGGCGQNIHEDCMDDWRSRQATCPMCRGVWNDENDQPLSVDTPLDPSSVDLYLDWLYSRGFLRIMPDLPDGQMIDTDGQSTFFNILRQHTVGVAMQDNKYTTAVMQIFIQFVEKQHEVYFLGIHVTCIYNDESIGETSRKLLVDAYMTTISENWFEEFSQYYPDAFIRDLGDACLRNMGAKPTLDDLLARHTAEQKE